jgi:hypothetical protein
VPDVSKWFEARSTEGDSAGICRHLDSLLAKLTGGATGPHAKPSAPDVVDTMPDPKQPDEPVNSL